MSYAKLEATIDGNYAPLRAKLQQADRLGEQFLSKVRQMKIEVDPQVIADLKQIADLRKQIGTGTTKIKIQTEGNASGAKAVRREIVGLGKDATDAGTKIAVVHKNLKELGSNGLTGARLNTKDLMSGLEEVRAGVLRFKKDFQMGAGTNDIVAQVNKLEHFFSGQGIKADAFNRVIPELQRVLELQNHIKGNREIDFEIHVKDSGVAEIKNLGIIIDGATKQLNDLNLKRRQIADELRNSGTVASVVGSKETVNLDLLKRLQQSKMAPNILEGTGGALAPHSPITRVQLEDLLHYDDLLEKARLETVKFQTELDKTARVAGQTTSVFEKVGMSMASRMDAAVQKTQKARDVYGAFGKHLEGIGHAASQLQNTIVRWALGYTVVSNLISGFQALKGAVIDFNGQLDDARVAFSTLLDSDQAADRLLNTLREFAKVTPFQFKDLVPLTQKMIALGVVAKNSAEQQIVPAFTAIGNAASALSGQGNGSPAEVVERIVRALGQMKSKGKLQAEELTGQLAEVGINGAKYVAQAMGVTVPKLFALMKKGAVDGAKAVKAILEGLGHDPAFAGLMEKQSIQFKGSLSNLQDAATDLASRGFRPLYDEAGRIIAEFARFGNSKAGEDWASRTASKMQQLVLSLRAAGRTLNDLRAPIEAIGAVIGLAFAAGKINMIVKMAGALIEFRNAAGALGAVEAAAQFLPALAPALAPLLAFLANPAVLAIVGGTIAIAGIYSWLRYKKNLAQVSAEHRVLKESALEAAQGLQTLTDAAAGNHGAEQLIAKVRRSVNDAGSDAKRMGSALDQIAKARYDIKNLKLDPLSLQIIQNELDRLKASIENKAVVLKVKIQREGDALPTDDGGAAAKAAYDQLYLKKVAQIRLSYRSGTGYNVPAMQRDSGTKSTDPEDLIDTLAQRATLTALLAQKAMTKAKASGTELSTVLESYRTAKTNPAQIAALKQAMALRDKMMERQKQGIALTMEEERALAKLHRVMVQRNQTMTHFGPTTDSEADREKKAKAAHKAALRLEKDRLTDSAQLNDEMATQAEKAYADMARAAEESGKRQLEALNGVRDSLKDLLGGMQEYLAKFGVFNSPLDAKFAQIQKLVNLGGRLKDVAQNTQSQIDNIRTAGQGAVSGYRLQSAHARMSLDKLSGGNGQEPAAAFKAGGAAAAGNAMLLQIAKSFTQGEPKLSCAFVASRLVNQIGASVATTSSAGQLRQNAIAAGWQRVQGDAIRRGDLIFNRRDGGSGWHVKTGGDNGDVINSNHRQETVFHYKMKPGDEIYRAPAMGAAGTSKSALAAGKAGGVLGQAVVDAEAGKDLIKEIFAELEGLKLTKLTEIPKAFGDAVKDTETNTFRFQGQMMLANDAVNKMLRTVLGEKKFNQLAHEIRAVTNEADGLKNSLEAVSRFEAQQKSIRDARRNRGVEDDPLGQFRRSLAKGGENYFMAGTMPAYKNAAILRGDLFSSAKYELDRLRSGEKDNLSVLRASAPFVTPNSVDDYGMNRAQELLSKKIDFRNTPRMKSLYRAGIEDKDIASLKLYNQLLRDFDHLQATAFDEGKGRARMEMVAHQRQEMNRQTDSLQRQLGLVRNSSLNETQLNDALEREGILRDKIQEYLDAGFTPARAQQLAQEAAGRQKIVNELERQIQRVQELRQLQTDTDLGVAKTKNETQITSRVPALAADSGVVRYAVERSSKVQDLLSDLKNGKLKYVSEMTDRLNAFDKEALAGRNRDAGTEVIRVQAQLEEKRLEAAGKITDLARQEAQWRAEDVAAQKLGVALTGRELLARASIRRALVEMQRLNSSEYLKNQRKDAQLASTYDPKMQRSNRVFEDARQQLGDKGAKAHLPELINIDILKERASQVQNVLAGIRDDFSQAFLNIKDRGLRSFTDMFQAISNRLQSFAADILANKVWDYIGGILGTFIGGRTGAPAAATGSMGSGSGISLHSHAAGLYRVPFDGYPALLHKNEQVLTSAQAAVERDRNRRDAARDTSRVGSNVQSQTQSTGAVNIYGPVHLPNVRNVERDLPGAVANQVQRAVPSRRSSARDIRRISEVGI